MKALPRLILGVVSAYYFGWKVGQKDKEKEMAGENPCLVNVGGELKQVPGAVCEMITSARGMLGKSGPYG